MQTFRKHPSILGVPGADGRGERRIDGRNGCEVGPGASEGLREGREGPWGHALGGLVREPVCVLASDWARILRRCIFCAQSATSLFHRSFRHVLYRV